MKKYHVHLKRGPEGNKTYDVSKLEYQAMKEALITKEPVLITINGEKTPIMPYHEPGVLTSGEDPRPELAQLTASIFTSSSKVSPVDQKLYLEFYGWLFETYGYSTVKAQYGSSTPWSLSQLKSARNGRTNEEAYEVLTTLT